MISFQKLFGKTDVFYSLLQASAEQSNKSVKALHNLLAEPAATGSGALDDFRLARQADKKITREINEQLCKVFVSDLDREDVEDLSNALYRIPKTVEKIAERFLICGGRVPADRLTAQLQLMERATEIVVGMVRGLSAKLDLEKVKEDNERLQLIEGNADNVMLDLLKDLYQGAQEPLQAIMLKDLYELMEKVIDRCRDAGNVVTGIVLKYS